MYTILWKMWRLGFCITRLREVYPYRECVTRKGVDLLAYDRLFAQVVNDDYRTAIEIACDRLMHPIELENHLREQYEQYLEQNAEVILKVLIPENKVEEISYLCDSCLIPEEALADALPLASEEKMSQIVAILMEYQRSNFERRKHLPCLWTGRKRRTMKTREQLEATGNKILNSVRTELYLSMRFMDRHSEVWDLPWICRREQWARMRYISGSIRPICCRLILNDRKF